MAEVSTNGTPIAVLKLINPDTGEAVAVYVKTCTDAVVCPDGKTAQEHITAIYGHIADDGIHLTVDQKANMETKQGAQAKATTAKTEAVAAASLLIQAAKTEAAQDATTKSEAARNAAYKYADDKAAVADAHAKDTGNPHKVTAAQVGLGNVPNKKTNDLEPTFTEASALEALISGEKLSVLFGKLAKAVSTLISHLQNASNPHKVTAKQAGAIPTTGGTITGDFTVDGGDIILKEGVNYFLPGQDLPEPGKKGRLLFKVVE